MEALSVPAVSVKDWVFLIFSGAGRHLDDAGQETATDLVSLQPFHFSPCNHPLAGPADWK
jgi:hypothetical protein